MDSLELMKEKKDAAEARGWGNVLHDGYSYIGLDSRHRYQIIPGVDLRPFYGKPSEFLEGQKRRSA